MGNDGVEKGKGGTGRRRLVRGRGNGIIDVPTLQPWLCI